VNNPCSQSWRRKRVYGGKNLLKVLSREWKSEEVMDDESGESTEQDDVIGVGRGESELDKLGWGWWSETGTYTGWRRINWTIYLCCPSSVFLQQNMFHDALNWSTWYSRFTWNFSWRLNLSLVDLLDCKWVHHRRQCCLTYEQTEVDRYLSFCQCCQFRQFF